MTRLYLVRNARTEEGVGFIENPALDDVGRIQAEAVADLLGSRPRMPIYCSPQKRALETAAPLAKRWLTAPVIDESITLMPLPDEECCDRHQWLNQFMTETWREAPRAQIAWRERCLVLLENMTADSVIVSHFLVINTIVAAAMGVAQTMVFQPDNGSITIVDAVDKTLSLVELGRQAATRTL